jgi:RNA polymerase sigma factor (sigma-70 family)
MHQRLPVRPPARGAAPADLRALSDEGLLGRFLASEGPDSAAAFEALVARHGPMVRKACRQVLAQPTDAEDAFQTTFLVLVRKAGSIRHRWALARWLSEVAYRTSWRARVVARRRRERERYCARPPAETASAPDPTRVDLRPVLREEVGRLPEKYRGAVTLCYFEGRTHEEAAALLRWPIGTLKGRLHRALRMLRRRVSRRGLDPYADDVPSGTCMGSTQAQSVPGVRARVNRRIRPTVALRSESS